MDKWSDLEIIHYLFYTRIDLLGRKLEDVLMEDEPELWREIYSRLNNEKT